MDRPAAQLVAAAAVILYPSDYDLAYNLISQFALFISLLLIEILNSILVVAVRLEYGLTLIL